MYLGIDLGTSEVKLLLLDDASAGYRRRTTNRYRCRVRSHFGPSKIHRIGGLRWQRAMARLMHTHASMLAAVKAIGLSGQMHGAVLLDEHDRRFAPGDFVERCSRWRAMQGTRRTMSQIRAQITGNLAMPGFTAPKLLWVAQHERTVFRRTAKVLLPKDYSALALSGDYVSEMSDAAGTLWLDVEKRDWSDVDACAPSGLSRDAHAALVEGCAPSGTLRPDLARAWGMGKGRGYCRWRRRQCRERDRHGCHREGQAFISLGTSGVFFVANDSIDPTQPRCTYVLSCVAGKMASDGGDFLRRQLLAVGHASYYADK